MYVKLLITGRVGLSEEIDLAWTEKIKASLQCLSCQHLVWEPSMSRELLLALPILDYWLKQLINIHLLCHQLPQHPVENHLSKPYFSPFPIQWK